MSKMFIRTAVLDVEIADSGPTDGFPVVLLHGFPDNARSWRFVAPALIVKGCRVLTPSLRGFGRTRFLDSLTPRNGQTAAFASDLIDIVDALKLERFVLIGHDIGASTAMLAAPLIAERLTGLMLLAPNLRDLTKNKADAFNQARAYWYKYYFCTKSGQTFFANNRDGFCRELWRTWSPTWCFDEAEFALTCEAFENPDFNDVVMHFYQHTSGEASGQPAYDALEKRSRAVPSLNIPTTVLHGADDACTLPVSSLGGENYFINRYSRQLLPSVGHFVQREAPGAVVEALFELLSKAAPH